MKKVQILGSGAVPALPCPHDRHDTSALGAHRRESPNGRTEWRQARKTEIGVKIFWGGHFFALTCIMLPI